MSWIVMGLIFGYFIEQWKRKELNPIEYLQSTSQTIIFYVGIAFLISALGLGSNQIMILYGIGLFLVIWYHIEKINKGFKQ